MRLAGERSDGVMLVDLGAGQFVLLDGVTHEHSVPIAAIDVDRFGPWRTSEARPDLRRPLERAHLTRRTWRLSADESFDDRRLQVDLELRELLGLPGNNMGYPVSTGVDFWVRDLGDGWVVYQIGGKAYKRTYKVNAANGDITFADPQPVTETKSWVADTTNLAAADGSDTASAASAAATAASERAQRLGTAAGHTAAAAAHKRAVSAHYAAGQPAQAAIHSAHAKAHRDQAAAAA